MFIKICGLREPGHVTTAVAAGADAVGFVLTESPRQVTPAQARALAALVPPGTETVAVFGGLPVAGVRAVLAGGGFSAVQLHGAYPRADFAALRDLEVKLVRAVPHAGATELCCGAFGEDLLLVDAVIPGSGQPWEWHDLADRPQGRWLLAGGLRPGNVAAALHAARPWGVDVSSGVEASRGVKDPALIREFISAARDAARQLPQLQ